MHYATMLPKLFKYKARKISVLLCDESLYANTQGAESKYASESRHRALARHPRLQPLHLLSVVEKVRASLIHLRGENTVIRSSQHSYVACPPRCLPDVAPLPAPPPARNTVQDSGAATAIEEQLLMKEDRNLLISRMEKDEGEMRRIQESLSQINKLCGSAT